MIPPRTTSPVNTRQQRRYPLPRRIRQLTTTYHKINYQIRPGSYGMALFFLNLGFRIGPRCAEAVLARTGQVDRRSDTAAFTEDTTRLVDRCGGITARDFGLIAFSTELFASQRRNGVYASSEFVFPLLAPLMVEQTVRRLDSDVDFQAIARPIVFRAPPRPAGERRRRLVSVD